jgi:UDP-glucose 4-epimerase
MTYKSVAQKSRKALVLGAAGFIGRHVCRELSLQGFFVKGLGHGNPSAEEIYSFGISEWLQADITLEQIRLACLNNVPDVIIHCGGSGSVAYSFSNPADDFNRSVNSTLAVLEYAREQSSPPGVVLLSSAAVYGDGGNNELSESSLMNPLSPYGYHKQASEILGESYHHFFGLKVAIIRLFSVYGDGLRKQLLWDAMNKYRKGVNSFLGTGEETRDWIHVTDAARLICLAANSHDDSFAIFNGGHIKASTQKILSLLAKISGSDLSPIFTGEVHPGNPRSLIADTSSASRELSFFPKVDLEKGLQQYVDWFNAREVDL